MMRQSSCELSVWLVMLVSRKARDHKSSGRRQVNIVLAVIPGATTIVV